jgi:hypothetical protein
MFAAAAFELLSKTRIDLPLAALVLGLNEYAN